MKTLMEETWYWTRIIGLWLLVAMLVWRWLRTRQFSKGHEILGLVAVFTSASLWLVLATAQGFATFFYPAFTITVALWIGYDNWYFFDSESYAPIIHESRQKFGLFWRDTVAARYLMSDSDAPANNPFTWKTAAIIGAILLPIALLFGFSRVVRYIVLTEHVRVEAYQQGKAETKQAVITAVSSVTSAVATSTNSITAGQGQILTKVDSTNRNATAAKTLAKENQKILVDGNRKPRPAQKATRTPTVNVTIHPVTIYPGPAMNREVKPPAPAVKPERKRRRFGWEKEESDTSTYARHE